MVDAFIGLGSNLGDRERRIRTALRSLAAHPAIILQRVSSFHRTAPVGPPGQGSFLNAVAMIQTSLQPRELLAVLQRVESRLGRRAGRRWGPREIDLDILLYGDHRIETDELRIPHPLMHGRLFVLGPLAEIAPDLRHPALDTNISELLQELERRTQRRGREVDCHIVVAGPIGTGKTTLALMLAARMRLMPLLEEPHRNPLLPCFYSDRRRYALHTQLWFLLDRAQRMAEIADLRPRRVVNDFLFEKDRIFAVLNLSPAESAIYRASRGILRAAPPRPDLVIYLAAEPSLLLRRVRERGRDSERPMSEEYIEGLCRMYESFFAEETDAPVVRIEAGDPAWDFNRRREAFERLLKRIVDYLSTESWCL